MKRADALSAIRLAGYHDDSREFARLYCENRVKRADADKAWRIGQAQKKAGMQCSCYRCKASQINH